MSGECALFLLYLLTMKSTHYYLGVVLHIFNPSVKEKGLPEKGKQYYSKARKKELKTLP